MNKAYQFLHFVQYAAIRNWSVQYMIGGDKISSLFPIRKLGEYINEESERYDISDPSKEYGILGVNNQIGIFDAYTESGAKIKQKYKRMKEGWIAYNPYRVNVGSVGVKKKEHQNDYISPAYVVFSCKKGLLPDFLYLLMKTPTFNQIIRLNTTGSVRQSLSFKNLKELTIPLPSLEEQNRLVNSYKSLINAANQLAEDSKNIEIETESTISQKLGKEIDIEKDIENSDQNKYLFLQLFHSRSITRWDVWNVKWKKNMSVFSQKQLSNIISLQSGQFLPAKKQCSGEYVVYGGNGETGIHNEYCYSGKAIVIGRVGEYCGNVHLIEGKYWITDNALKVDKLTDEVSWEYLAIALNNLRLNDYKSISAQPSISQKRILQMNIPIPPKEIQEEIVSYVSAAKAHIRELQTKAASLKAQALHDFERALFK